MGLWWATAEELARSKPLVLSLYRNYLRALRTEKLGLSLAAQESKKAHVRELFDMGAREHSIHNIRDLIDAAEYTLTLLRKGQIPRESYNKASNINMCGIALSLSGVHIEGHLCDTADLEIPSEEQQEGPSIADLSEGLKRRGPDSLNKETVHVTSSIKIDFIGSLLSLRGDRPVSQPVKDNRGNILVYNGEIFGGLQVEGGENDTLRLMGVLSTCCACACHGTPGDDLCACNGEGLHVTVQNVLSALRGPWALVYWQAENQVLWFGRDVLGRRSLLMRRPSRADPRFLLTSVAPEGVPNWEELQCGIYSLSCNTGLTHLHEWEDPLLRKLVTWDRQHFDPDILLPRMTNQQVTIVDTVLNVLRRSVRKRTCNIRKRHQEGNDAYTPVAVLFSGGLDSMILAALLDEYLPPENGIDLLNVSFEGSTAPDRISALAGLAELQRVSPSRRWRLVKIDADLTAMDSHRTHLQSLICPSNTFMDLNIGTALWLAARGEGYLHEGSEGSAFYKSSARVLLVGAGADEQCGGYGRHRTKFRLGGWSALQAEMRLDMQRIWKRNLGRDDRCMADVGKEARFPFLDEEVVETLLDLPLWDIVDLRLPIGSGDKRVLREVAMKLGLPGAASLPKRAIQFGSRIARESNKREFGSNRAANQASAGSALLPGIAHST